MGRLLVLLALSVAVESAPPARLRVIDAATGLDLAGVTVVQAESPHDARPWHVLVADGASPLDRPALHGGADFWFAHLFVRAPGYAWKAVGLDRSGTGTRTVALRRSGDLRVELSGAVIDPELRVRILQDGWPIAWRATRGAPSAAFEGLRPGHCRAEAFLGGEWIGGLVLAGAEFDLAEGDSRVVRLAVPPSPRVEPVEVTVAVDVAPEWGAGDADLTVEPLGPVWLGETLVWTGCPLSSDDFPRSSLGPGRFRFGPLALQPGRYRLLPGFGRACEAEVRPGSVAEISIDVPPPRIVTVRTIDAGSGETARAEGIRWVTGEGGADWTGTITPGAFRLRSIPGALDVEVDDGYWFGPPVHLPAGGEPGVVEIPVRHGGRIEVRFREGGQRVRSEDLGPAEEVRIGASGHERALVGEARQFDDAFGWLVSRAGAYRVSFPAYDGYEPVPDLEVEVRAGGTTVLPVDLVPLR
ncbi:MAG: hypothetical protein MUE73_20160 [Planctomycetes bacterium]|jgi:hypothetical protein|nr:hypothetical protein [Planctomycetota bacterium]